MTSLSVPSPFSLDDDGAYRAWRDAKLDGYPTCVEELLVEVDDPCNLTEAQKSALDAHINQTNMVIYVSPVEVDEAQMGHFAGKLGASMGLRRLDANMGADEDSLTALQVVEGAGAGTGEYIPYTNKKLNWHTDGYYNEDAKKIHGMILHCVRPAAQGGENALLDQDIAYIKLRDENPDWVRALMHPQALTTPANVQNGEVIRPDRSTPVFSINADGSLQMDYTERKRNIIWREDPATKQAVAFLREFMASDSPYIFNARLQAGWGLICNNVLHTRTPFEDDPARPRLIYRGRYYDRIQS